MLPQCVLVDRAAFAIVNIQIGKLLVPAPNILTVAKADQFGLQLVEEELDVIVFLQTIGCAASVRDPHALAWKRSRVTNIGPLPQRLTRAVPPFERAAASRIWRLGAHAAGAFPRSPVSTLEDAGVVPPRPA